MKVDTLKNNQADEHDRVLRAVGKNPKLLNSSVTIEPFEWLVPVLKKIEAEKFYAASGES